MRGTHRATAAENAAKHVPKDIAGREMQREMAIIGKMDDIGSGG